MHCHDATVNKNDLVSLSEIAEGNPDYFKCPKCDLKFMNVDDVKAHQEADHAANCCYLCSFCGAACCSKQELDNHVVTLHQKNAIIDNDDVEDGDSNMGEVNERDDVLSPNTLPTSSPHNFHIGLDHAVPLKSKSGTTYACRICFKDFPSRSLLNVHYTHTHRDKPQYECEFCGKVFTIKRELSTHRRVHSGEPLHSCQKCGKIFGTKQLLKKHHVWHTGNRDFICPKCGKAFYQKGHLTQHMMIHAGGRPHACKLCGKTFIFKFDLNRHLKIHAERGQSCMYCGDGFESTFSLQEHLKICTQQKNSSSSQSMADLDVVDQTFKRQRSSIAGSSSVDSISSSELRADVDDDVDGAISPQLAAEKSCPNKLAHNSPTVILPTQPTSDYLKSVILPSHASPYGIVTPAAALAAMANMTNMLQNTGFMMYGPALAANYMAAHSASDAQQALVNGLTVGLYNNNNNSSIGIYNNGIAIAHNDRSSQSSGELNSFTPSPVTDNVSHEDSASLLKKNEVNENGHNFANVDLINSSEMKFNLSGEKSIFANVSDSIQNPVNGIYEKWRILVEKRMEAAERRAEFAEKALNQTKVELEQKNLELKRWKEQITQVGAIATQLLGVCERFDSVWLLHSRKLHTQLHCLLKSLDYKF